MTGFVYHFNGGTGLNDIIVHELMFCDVLVLVVDNRKINDWNEYNLRFSFINQNMHTVCNIYKFVTGVRKLKCLICLVCSHE